MTNKPFREAVADLLEERNNMSQRELCRRAQPKSGGYPHITTFNAVMIGDMEPSMHMVEAVAKGFGDISPEYFAEYRLEKVRESLDWTGGAKRLSLPDVRVKLGKALRTLEDLSEPEPHQPTAEEKEHL